MTSVFVRSLRKAGVGTGTWGGPRKSPPDWTDNGALILVAVSIIALLCTTTAVPWVVTVAAIVIGIALAGLALLAVLWVRGGGGMTSVFVPRGEKVSANVPYDGYYRRGRCTPDGGAYWYRCSDEWTDDKSRFAPVDTGVGCMVRRPHEDVGCLDWNDRP